MGRRSDPVFSFGGKSDEVEIFMAPGCALRDRLGGRRFARAGARNRQEHH
jgi:hypothetical protein